jgi:hypothetical protein
MSAHEGATIRSRVFGGAAFVAAVVLVSSTARGQSFGVQDQVLRMVASDFQGEDYVEGWIGPDGYLYGTDGVDTRVATSLILPDGAVITRLCVATRDSNVGPPLLFYAWIRADKLVPGGEAPASKLLKLVDSADHSGYGSSCSTVDPPITIRDRIDVDDDGTLDAAAYRVGVFIADPGTDISLAFAAVEITWHRQVSPPPASPTFADVPETDGAWPQIEALAASGITAGCGGDKFCPDATLTRRQMAVFLAKALGLHWGNP